VSLRLVGSIPKGGGTGIREAGSGASGGQAHRLNARLFDIVGCMEGMRGRRSPGAGFRLDATWNSDANAYLSKCHALFYAFVSGTSMSPDVRPVPSGPAVRMDTST
jgi:hypothetical protein